MFYKCANFFAFGLRNFKQKFIVHLKQYAAFITALFQHFLHVHHGYFYNVRRRALYRRVNGGPLRKAAQVKVAAVNIRQVTPAPEQRLHIAMFFGARHHIIHIFFNAGVASKIIFNISACLATIDIKLFGKPKIADAVYNAKVYRFGACTHGTGNFVQRHAKHFRRRACVYILPVQEAFQKQFILRNMRQHAQFHLRIIAA